MKKILFAAFAVSLLTVGCQKTEVIHQVGPTDGSLMSFSTEMGKLTKSSDNANPGADKDGMYNLRAQEFRIWAYCDYDDSNTDDNDPTTTDDVELDKIYDGMANLNIGYDRPADYEGADANDKGTWAPEKEYYWPSAGKSLRFFAVSGVNLGEDLSEQNKVNITITRSKGTDNVETVNSTLTIQDYIVDNTNPNNDLMVAKVVTLDKNKNNKYVKFNFQHALSKVQFNFKAGVDSDSDAAVKVKSLTVNGIKTIGDLEVVNDQISWTGQALSTPETKNSFTFTSDEGVQLTTTDATLATWLVIPQDIVTKTSGTIDGGYSVVVVYEIGEREFTATFPLYVADTLVKWDKNQYTKYLVTITPNKITFHASAQEWTPYDSDNDGTSDDIDLQN